MSGMAASGLMLSPDGSDSARRAPAGQGAARIGGRYPTFLAPSLCFSKRSASAS